MELLTISKAAKKLGVHPNSLRNWEKRGLIKPGRLPGGQRRYSMDELNKLLQSGRLPDGRATAVLYARVSTKKQADAGNLERSAVDSHVLFRPVVWCQGWEESQAGVSGTNRRSGAG